VDLLVYLPILLLAQSLDVIPPRSKRVFNCSHTLVISQPVEEQTLEGSISKSRVLSKVSDKELQSVLD
jgi:hypothetical protein